MPGLPEHWRSSLPPGYEYGAEERSREIRDGLNAYYTEHLTGEFRRPPDLKADAPTAANADPDNTTEIPIAEEPGIQPDDEIMAGLQSAWKAAGINQGDSLQQETNKKADKILLAVAIGGTAAGAVLLGAAAAIRHLGG